MTRPSSAPNAPPPAVELHGVSVRFPGSARPALDDVTLSVPRGRRVAVLGPSGSGKTTLLRAIAGLVRPSGGSVCVGGVCVSEANRGGLRALRRRVGIVFQEYHLVGRLPALTNVLCGTLGSNGTWRALAGAFPAEEKERARALLARVGLGGEEFARRRADSLSGGEKQRVAIARALMQSPDILLVDEPVASLDVRSAEAAMDLLLSIQEERRLTMLITLHNLDLARKVADFAVGLNKGRVVWSGATRELVEGRIEEIFGAETVFHNVLRFEDHA